jgi:hypothetical protein
MNQKQCDIDPWLSQDNVSRTAERKRWHGLRLALILTMLLASCATNGPQGEEQSNPFTHGNVQLTLKKGETTQAEVLEKFGAPNVTTIDASGLEVWTYQKYATVSRSHESGAYATVILLGGGQSTSGFEQSSRTMTLIIKFGADKKVTDFKSMATSF